MCFNEVRKACSGMVPRWEEFDGASFELDEESKVRLRECWWYQENTDWHPLIAWWSQAKSFAHSRKGWLLRHAHCEGRARRDMMSALEAD